MLFWCQTTRAASAGLRAAGSLPNKEGRRGPAFTDTNQRKSSSSTRLKILALMTAAAIAGPWSLATKQTRMKNTGSKLHRRARAAFDPPSLSDSAVDLPVHHCSLPTAAQLQTSICLAKNTAQHVPTHDSLSIKPSPWRRVTRGRYGSTHMQHRTACYDSAVMIKEHGGTCKPQVQQKLECGKGESTTSEPLLPHRARVVERDVAPQPASVCRSRSTCAA